MQKRVYGWKPDTPEQRASSPRLKLHPRSLLTVPNSVDLRQYFPEVFDQGAIGSCTANMSAGMIMYDQKVQGQDWVMPSRMFDYFNSRLREGTTDSDAGASITDAILAIAQYGWCPESEYSYGKDHLTVKPPQQCYDDAATNKITDYARVNQDLSHLQATLAAGHPIGFGFIVYPSFESEHVASTGIMTMPTIDDLYKGPLGGHAVILVGFDNARQAFLVRNSWSRSWGIAGYFWMPFQYALRQQLASDFMVINSIPGTSLDWIIVGDAA